MNENFVPELRSPAGAREVMQFSPLVLAFVGDAVHTLYSRTKHVFSGDFKAGALHRLVAEEVKAAAQCKAAKTLLAEFTEEEGDVFRRARNSKVHTAAKNASIIDYKTASGLEAVYGFLYLTGRHERLFYLLHKSEER